jgi:hypothetical protein
LTIDDAMAVLEAALARSRSGPVQTEDVRAALRTLLPHCAERWPLAQFWEAAARDHGAEFARFQNLHAALNGIARQIGRKRT